MHIFGIMVRLILTFQLVIPKHPLLLPNGLIGGYRMKTMESFLVFITASSVAVIERVTTIQQVKDTQLAMATTKIGI